MRPKAIEFPWRSPAAPKPGSGSRLSARLFPGRFIAATLLLYRRSLGTQFELGSTALGFELEDRNILVGRKTLKIDLSY